MSFNGLLTAGCIEDMLHGKEMQKPVVQILGSKRIAGVGEQSERYRLLISDGQNLYSFAMLATQLNELHQSGQLEEYAVIRIERFITSLVNRNERGEKRVLIILELTIIKPGSSVATKIGNPQPLSEGGASTGNSGSVRTESAGSISSGSAHQNRSHSYPKHIMQSTYETITNPINSLSPYQNKWIIKARVMSKSNIRTWNNAKGEGKLFSMDLKDESGEIRVTAFKEQCDKFYDMIEVDKVYYLSKCQLKPANKQYSTLKNDYEMTMTADTVLQECEDEGASIPTIQYDFVPIPQIANMEAHAIIDVVGVCKDAGEINQFTAKASGRELKKRDVTLVDKSNTAVQLTLWGDDAVNFPASLNPVLVLKSVRVTEFGGGKSLGLVGGSVMKINPHIDEAHKLRGWFDNGGCPNTVQSVSARTGPGTPSSAEWMTIHEATEKKLGSGDKPGYFQTKGVIHNIKSETAVYRACPQPDCNKKVVDQDNGSYRCEKCDIDFPNYKYRLLLQMLVSDWSSNRWVTAFADLAEQLLGKTSQEVGDALSYNKETAELIFSEIYYNNFVFKLRTKLEYYSDAPRNKTTAISITTLNHKEFNGYLIKNIQELTGIGKK